ncbi:MAG: hypothetical protein CSA62_14955 [Planctomycetota bacterium]|nr:MAG: hypothetical protein CSA62_14955 [Planctomycetota bacterium]
MKEDAPFAGAVARPLLMTATEREAERLRPLPVAVAAFGQIDGALAAMQLMSEQRPGLALLLGLAGTLCPEELPIGTVLEASAFRCFGIGAGAEPDLLGPEAMGLPEGCHGRLVPAELELASASLGDSALPRAEFLSVCSASAGLGQARARAARFPQAKVEEMEGFGVARAARLLGIPFTSVRAVSNVAGERDPACWDLDRAFAALSRQLAAFLESCP